MLLESRKKSEKDRVANEISFYLQLHVQSVTYIRVTRNSNEIPLLDSNNTVGYLTQVNEGNSISFIYTIGFYRCFGIHSVISLLFIYAFDTFINTEIIK